jgi:hypothetical protein
LGAAEAKRTGINTTFTYDAKGNMLSGNGLTYTYTASNKPATITRGTASVSFDHDPEHQRYAQTSLSGVTLYISGGGVLAERFAGTGGTVRWTNCLTMGGVRLIGPPCCAAHVTRCSLATKRIWVPSTHASGLVGTGQVPR